MAQCQFWDVAHEHPDSSGFHDKCQFPAPHIVNPYDSVWFTLGEVNWDQGFFDVHVLNPHNRIVGYQFDVSCGIQQVVSLVDPLAYMIQPEFALGGNTIIGLSYEDASIPKQYEWSPLCRIYWTQTPETELCINGITEVVNNLYQNAVPYLVDGCATTSSVGGVIAGVSFAVSPNPVVAGAPLLLTFTGGEPSGAEVRWLDLTGRVVSRERWNGGRTMELSTAGRAPGAYLVQLVRTTTSGVALEYTERVTVR